MAGEDEAFWATEDGVTQGDVTLKWDKQVTVKYIVIQEHIALGQRVKEFCIEVRNGRGWQQVGSGTTVGYKRIIPLDEAVTTDELRIRFLDARGALTIARIAVY